MTKPDDTVRVVATHERTGVQQETVRGMTSMDNTDDLIARLIERWRNSACYDDDSTNRTLEFCADELEAALRGVRDSPPLDEGIARLIAQWREDADKFAHTVADTGLWGGIAEGYRSCADQLETFWRGVRDGRREEPAQ